MWTNRLINVRSKVSSNSGGTLILEKYNYPLQGRFNLTEGCEYDFCIKQWFDCDDNICKSQIWEIECERDGIANPIMVKWMYGLFESQN